MKLVIIGGTGLIGSKLVTGLKEHGHEAVAASPDTGVNTLTGAGLAEALQGASVVVDVSNSPSFEDTAVMAFFTTSTQNLLKYAEAAGVARSRIVLLGFSQGACLTSEFAVRHASRFGAVIVFTGGLIGPPGTEWHHPGDFAGTPVFFGSGDPDAHVPVARVLESAEVFTRMGADVKTSIYPGRGHWVGDEEVEIARAMLDRLAPPA